MRFLLLYRTPWLYIICTVFNDLRLFFCALGPTALRTNPKRFEFCDTILWSLIGLREMIRKNSFVSLWSVLVVLFDLFCFRWVWIDHNVPMASKVSTLFHLRSIHSERKRKRKPTCSLMYVTYSWTFFSHYTPLLTSSGNKSFFAVYDEYYFDFGFFWSFFPFTFTCSGGFRGALPAPPPPRTNFLKISWGFSKYV